MDTGKSIAIKFARSELFYSLEREYKNYLHLGADGTTNIYRTIKLAINKKNSEFDWSHGLSPNIFALDRKVIDHGIPHIMYFGDFAGYKVLVMTKTGQTLHFLRGKTRFGKFGIKTLSKIAIQGVR